MSAHFSMGAINKTTNSYEYPKIANKINKYKCPFCETNVIFRNGKIKKPHFAHYKSDNPCSYYEHPNESQIHKDAKLLMKTVLDNKRLINIYRKCYYCYEDPEDFLNITKEEYNDNVSAVIEHKFNYNNSNRSADVALLHNKQIKYIFEICYKNPTKEENRPEPWFEIKAETLINETNSGENINEEGEINIECIRDYKCGWCKDKEEYERKIQLEVLVKFQIREKEQKQAKNELLNMSKEDEMSIQKQRIIELNRELKRENERIERYFFNKKLEEEKEIELKKQKEEKKRDGELMRKFLVKDNKCGICNINFCKCDKPNFLNNEYNRIICNSCKKYKCMCVKITEFFKKNNIKDL